MIHTFGVVVCVVDDGKRWLGACVVMIAVVEARGGMIQKVVWKVVGKG